ncbi:MAG: DNA-3-methyladenine glycosylase 2 family protein [Planctomycetes bacterium]|nr:DNA-3-methyladenine glycosylase 2 family protein [Planctomycetota bacterium]
MPSKASTQRRRALAHFREVDPTMADAVCRLDPMPDFPIGPLARQSNFVYLARSIVFQQLAGAAASTIWGRYAALTPGRRPPSPEELLALPEAKLRGAGLSRNKLASIRDLAQRVVEGDLRLRSLSSMDNQEVIDHLVQVRGIGPWTAQVFLMFKLGRLDVLPPADLGLQEGMRILDGLERRPTAKKLEQRAAAWSPFRTQAAWTLWRVVDEVRT